MLVRNLQTRHLNMIALGGSIGTGIFLASGYAIHVAGPGGALLAYALIAVMVFFLITSLGELATYRPTAGSFCEYATVYVDPAFGFAMSYNYWFNWAITLAAEVSAAAIIMQFWFPDTPLAWFAGSFFGLVLLGNVFSIRVFGETEYWMSFIKVAAIIVFIVLASFMVFQKPQFGLTVFTLGDAPFHNGWTGFLAVFLAAGFAFQGCELIGIGAGEAKDPSQSIPKAVKNVFWRLLLFYILATLLIGLLIPYNDPALAVQDNVKASPFTLVFAAFFGKSLATNVMNLIILIAIISAANASLYASTRTLWHMGNIGQAPKCFAKTTRYGLPLPALIATAVVAGVVFLFSLLEAGKLFSTLLTVSSLCGFIAWFGIALSHYCFRTRHLHHDTRTLTYRALFFPAAPLLAMGFIITIILGQGWNVIADFSWSALLTQYGALLVFLTVMLAHKLLNNNQQP